jgi:hypothetical protein
MFGTHDKTIALKSGVTPHFKNAHRMKELQVLRKEIPQILQQNFLKYSLYHNKKTRSLSLEIGDKVLLKVIEPRKLELRFQRPFSVSKITEQNTLTAIKDGVETRFHFSRVKKYVEREEM